MRKLLPLLLVLAVAVLAGCGPADDSPQATEAGEKTSQAPAATTEQAPAESGQTAGARVEVKLEGFSFSAPPEYWVAQSGDNWAVLQKADGDGSIQILPDERFFPEQGHSPVQGEKALNPELGIPVVRGVTVSFVLSSGGLASPVGLSLTGPQDGRARLEELGKQIAATLSPQADPKGEAAGAAKGWHRVRAQSFSFCAPDQYVVESAEKDHIALREPASGVSIFAFSPLRTLASSTPVQLRVGDYQASLFHLADLRFLVGGGGLVQPFSVLLEGPAEQADQLEALGVSLIKTMPGEIRLPLPDETRQVPRGWTKIGLREYSFLAPPHDYAKWNKETGQAKLSLEDGCWLRIGPIKDASQPEQIQGAAKVGDMLISGMRVSLIKAAPEKGQIAWVFVVRRGWGRCRGPLMMLLTGPVDQEARLKELGLTIVSSMDLR